MVYLLDQEIKENAQKFLKAVNKELPDGMELEYEGFFKRGFFVTKKRYALIEDETIVVKGLELVRRDWAPITKNTQRKVINAILKDASPEKAVKIVKSVIEDIKKGNVKLEDLVIHTQLTKNPHEYTQMAPHVLAAKKSIERGRNIGRGSIIRYVVVRGKEPISKRAEPIEDAKLSNYDPNYYIENQVLPAVGRIIESFGYSEQDILHKEKQSSLDAFF
ncbi:DNA polymerase domain-containing protein [Methanobacterium sp. ACI-7]|uniref:DNA polymerase domain-containing protein n=1 Tax=unclassified Methanobacterium TaxID=2627676 RepID=UPI0039C488C8